MKRLLRRLGKLDKKRKQLAQRKKQAQRALEVYAAARKLRPLQQCAEQARAAKKAFSDVRELKRLVAAAADKVIEAASDDEGSSDSE